jgi:putative Mg2+ transporter-C (MgtC) family protein
VITDLDFTVILTRLALSFAASFALGWNREELGHPAGMRTIVLLCLAACTAMLLGSWLLTETSGAMAGLSRLDLMRLPQGILAGIGFIGAGTILKQGATVRGVTTAATVWLATVVGLCFGAGAWRLGLATTLIALATLQGLGLIEQRLKRRSYGTVTLAFDPEVTSHAALLQRLRSEGLGVQSSTLGNEGGKGTLRCVGAHRGSNPDWAVTLVASFRRTDGVQSVSWEEMA